MKNSPKNQPHITRVPATHTKAFGPVTESNLDTPKVEPVDTKAIESPVEEILRKVDGLDLEVQLDLFSKLTDKLVSHTDLNTGTVPEESEDALFTPEGWVSLTAATVLKSGSSESNDPKNIRSAWDKFLETLEPHQRGGASARAIIAGNRLLTIIETIKSAVR